MNYCLCCKRPATLFGSAGTSYGPDGKIETMMCQREICHDCNERCCPCGGGRLAKPAFQIHENCGHVGIS